jgi:hypothetical protein
MAAEQGNLTIGGHTPSGDLTDNGVHTLKEAVLVHGFQPRYAASAMDP